MGQACCAQACEPPEARQSAKLAAAPGPIERQVIFLKELRALWSMPQESIDAYFAANEVMGQDKITCRAEEDMVIDWYNVLNHFCALGNVEKMYIAPVLDAAAGNQENQRLFEEHMSRMLCAGIGKSVLDLGCGKGRIANEVATYSGARVVGLNYDKSQIDNALQFAELRRSSGVELEFLHGTFNDPLPFESHSFDAAYEVGAFCYAIDKVALFTEIFRVLKPGGRFSYCDWCRLEYNPEDEHHVELLRKVKPLTGMVEMPFPREVEEAFVQSGFEIELSAEACAGGEQFSHVVRDTERSFWLAESVVNAADRLHLAPKNLKRLWDRIREGGQALQEAVELNLFSMTWHIVARKPELASLSKISP